MNRMLKEIRRRRMFGMLALYFVGAWGVLQVAALVFPGWQVPDEAIRYVWIGTAILFPLAVWFSWRYDISKDGLSITAPEGGAAQPIERHDIAYLSVATVIVVAVVAAVSAQVLELRDASDSWAEDNDVPMNSVAVLPFVNMSGDAENEYFSDGISEQLLHELAAVPNLFVAARTSAFYFKGRNDDMRSIGRALGVRTLLEGSVRKSGNSVRITAQLINAEDGFHLWSKVFDAELEDVFAIQDEIADNIVRSLSVSLAPGTKGRLRQPLGASAESYDRFLRAMAIRGEFANDAVVRSNEMLEEVIEASPDFALAYAKLAYGYVLQTYYGSLSETDAADLVEPLLDRALELQPDLEDAYETWGLLYTRTTHYDEANAAFEKALEINPQHYGSRFNYAFSLTNQSRLREASAAYLQAQASDRMNTNLSFNLGALFMLMGDYPSGRRYMERALELDPKRVSVAAVLASWTRRFGHLQVASQMADDLHVKSPENVTNTILRTSLQMDYGNLEEASEILGAARANEPDNQWLISAQYGLWLAEENLDALYEHADADYALVDAVVGDPIDNTEKRRVHRYGWSMLMRGEAETAASILHWAAGGEDGLRSTTYDEMESMKMLAVAYRRSGRLEESDELLEQCLQLAAGARNNGWATPQLHYRTAEIHAIRGDAGGAAEALSQAYDAGWREISNLEYGIYWDELADDPAIEDIKVRVYEDIEAQRMVGLGASP